MLKPLVIIGAGGHASVLVDILRQQKRNIVAIVSPDIDYHYEVFSGIERFVDDNDVLKFKKESVKLVNGIGVLPNNNLRSLIYDKFVGLGYEFETVIAGNSIVSRYAKLQKGVQIMSGVVIQTGTVIGENTIVNTGVIVDHDCKIGRDNHLAPGAVLCGAVSSKERVHFGTGCNVIQCVTIGNDAVIGAGVAVTKNIAAFTTCYPARGEEKVINDE